MNSKSTPRLWVLPVMVLLVGIGLSACKSATDKAVENAIESTTGTDATVDSSANRVAVNVNGTSWETGDVVSLPANFPDDIYVAEGTLKVAIANDANQGFTISLESSDSVADVKARYQKELADDGWTITGTADMQGSASVVATKAKRSTTVTIGTTTDSSKTIVNISTFTDTSPEAPSTEE